MGKRGPPPGPNSKRSREGKNTFKPTLVDEQFRAPPVKPRPAFRVPKFPKGLGVSAHAYWKRHAKALAIDGRLDDRTLDEFTELCFCYQAVRDAAVSVAKYGRIHVLPNGRPTRSGYVIDYERATKLFLRLSDRFGMKPQRKHYDPLKVQPDPTDDDDILD